MALIQFHLILPPLKLFFPRVSCHQCFLSCSRGVDMLKRVSGMGLPQNIKEQPFIFSWASFRLFFRTIHLLTRCFDVVFFERHVACFIFGANL